MKTITFVIFAIFAAVALAAPAFEADKFDVSELEFKIEDTLISYEGLKELGFTDEEIEVYVSVYASLVQRLKDKIKALYDRVCQRNNADVCKRWANKHITRENVEKLWREIKPLVKKYCSNKTDALCVAVRVIL